ncbi:conserved hypothetical protein [Methylocella tundrae]|nr:conserved hypothetical protein [Methylocella tundrae]
MRCCDFSMAPPGKGEGMRAARVKDLLGSFISEVWNDGDADAAGRFLAPRYTIHHDPGDLWDGRVLDLAGFQERVRISRAPFPDQKFAIERLCADGDAVAMTWLWSATHAGDIPGFPATGKTIRMSGSTLYFVTPRVRLSGHWQITDRIGVLRQLQANKDDRG